VHAVSPTEPELSQLQEIGIPSELLGHVLDFNERSRVVRRGDIVFIVMHLPNDQTRGAGIPYVTAPTSIFLLPDLLVTIEPMPMGLQEELSATPPSGLSSNDMTQFVLRLLLFAGLEYLTYLQDINRGVDEAESRLQNSLRNREVLQLLNYQKSLIYFTTALNSIEMLLEKLRKGDFLVWSSEDDGLAEDALIEIRQAIYQVDIAQMMDAFASIVSNNLNTVMKFLAAITIIISVPMLIASLYGMNVQLPGGSEPTTFAYLIIMSVLLSVIVIILFRRKDWL
jgi:magnesium transporter